jgi:hypothetical protein
MVGAVERPFSSGQAPITKEQVDALVALTARLAAQYDIPVTRETVLTHAEVQTTLGVKQRNKWDIMWLPGMTGPDNPVVVGDKLRGLIKNINNKPLPSPAPTSLLSSVLYWLGKLFNKP